jgi:hypothetical protein
MRNLLLILGLFFTIHIVQGQVVINEFSCSNYTLGVGGDNEDYIEFYNPGVAASDIGGYYLSDNPANPDKFEIPAGTFVPAGGYLLVMCSGEGELLPNLYIGGNLNTNFKVNQCAGEAMVFSDPGGAILEEYVFVSSIGTTQADHSWARDSDGGALWSICTNPTPEAANGADMFSGYATTPVFSDEAGFYAGGLNVAIDVPVGYEVRYTTDGYAPDAFSTLYTGAINISTTSLINVLIANALR